MVTFELNKMTAQTERNGLIILFVKSFKISRLMIFKILFRLLLFTFSIQIDTFFYYIIENKFWKANRKEVIPKNV